MGTNISYIRDKKNEKGITPKSNDNTRETETAVVKIHFFEKALLQWIYALTNTTYTPARMKKMKCRSLLGNTSKFRQT